MTKNTRLNSNKSTSTTNDNNNSDALTNSFNETSVAKT